MNDHRWIAKEQTGREFHQECAYCGAAYLRLERAGEWQRYLVKSDGTVIRKPVSHGGSMGVTPCLPR